MIDKIIENYLKKDLYPFHMPGHKRNPSLDKTLGYGRDFTEIEGLDNLNDPKEVFVAMEEKIASIYGVESAVISVNGTTSGILATIRALSMKNKKALVERSSHKSVFNAGLINDLDYDYIDVITDENSAIRDISYEDLEKSLKENSYSFVLVTSPSYEGYVLDLEKIYGLCKKYDTKLIVDLAHGSHLVLTGDYQKNFDIAITSFHKNLPALTPAACVLINDKSLEGPIRKNMAIFQSSSPSYLILQSIGEMLGNFDKFKDLYQILHARLSSIYELDLKNLKIVKAPNKDISKLLISTKDTNINGSDLQKMLKDRKIEIEMAYPSYALLIASIYDTEEGFLRLRQALLDIDKDLIYDKKESKFSYIRPKKIINLSEAEKLDSELTKLENAKGKVSADFIYAYPPGIPLLCPGELISDKIIENIGYLEKNGIGVNTKKGKISTIIDKN